MIHVCPINDYFHRYRCIINNLTKESHSQRVDFVMHSGDLSYANGEQPVWDKYYFFF